MLRLIRQYFEWRVERFYKKNYWHLIIDSSLLIMIIILLVWIFAIRQYHPQTAISDNPIISQHLVSDFDPNNPPIKASLKASSTLLTVSGEANLLLSLENSSKKVVRSLCFDLPYENLKIEKTETALPTGVSLSEKNICFEEIAANSQAEIPLSIHLEKSGQRTVELYLSWKYNYFNEQVAGKSEILKLYWPASIDIKSLAYYNSPQGDQLGVGPLPPIVSLPTTYWVFWDLSSASDLENVVLTATLPKNIELSGQRSVLMGDFRYNEASRQISWIINKLSPDNNDSGRLGFELRLTPTINDLGKKLLLISDPRYQALDTITGSRIKGVFSEVDTDLKDDHFNAGKGTVVNE